jgi:hypothetical protein
MRYHSNGSFHLSFVSIPALSISCSPSVQYNSISAFCLVRSRRCHDLAQYAAALPFPLACYLSEDRDKSEESEECRDEVRKKAKKTKAMRGESRSRVSYDDSGENVDEIGMKFIFWIAS